jgi:hypothetical protein
MLRLLVIVALFVLGGVLLLASSGRSQEAPAADPLVVELTGKNHRLRAQLGRERNRHRVQLRALWSENHRLHVIARDILAPTIAGNRRLAQRFFGDEFPCADEIITGESNYDHLVWNRQGSGAYGLGQARPRSKMLAYGADAYTNPLTQLRWFRGYAEARYGSVCGAAAHWTATVSW